MYMSFQGRLKFCPAEQKSMKVLDESNYHK